MDIGKFKVICTNSIIMETLHDVLKDKDDEIKDLLRQFKSKEKLLTINCSHFLVKVYVEFQINLLKSRLVKVEMGWTR